MNRELYVRRRPPSTDVRPALMWFTLTLFLIACAGMSFLGLRVLTGEWLELKLDSARYRVMELLPEPERPDFMSTPIRKNASSTAPTIVWSKNVGQTVPTESPHIQPTTVAIQAPPELPTPAPVVQTSSFPLKSIQPAVQLTGVVHEAQRFNNCGPTTLRMYLSYFGYTQDSQVQIANILKPYKEDRNVGPDELTGYVEAKGYHALVRVNGDLDRLKQFLSNDLPVMIEEGYDPPRAKQGWMGHYILLTGYDAEGITAQDSYNGPNQRVAWRDVDNHWRNFNRTYILFYTDAQEPMVRAIIGEDMDDTTMYAKAAQRAQDEWNANPNDAFAAFNLGSSLVGLQDYEAAANAFDQARHLQLPWRMMWYQFGPYEAYYRVGRYDEVIALADATLKPTGDLEESYYYKGLALQQLGRSEEAREAFLTALRYNSNYLAAQEALRGL
jgi:uncharacterized protein YvpB